MKPEGKEEKGSGAPAASGGKKSLLQVMKFALIGVWNTVLDYLIFYLLFNLAGWNKNLAQVLSTAIAMTNSYFFNRYWTFEKKGRAQVGEMWKFVLVNLASMCVTLLCLNVFYDVLHLERLANALLGAAGVGFRLGEKGAVMFCKLASMPFSLTVNFLGNRLWVFRKNAEKREQDAE